MSENNDTSNDSNSLGGATVLQASRLGATNPLLRGGVLRPSVLGPSVLGTGLGNNSALASIDKNDKDEVVKNPFLKETNDDEEDTESGAVGGKTSEEATVEDNEETDERPDPLKLLRKNGIERVSMFASAKNSIPGVGNSGFVFGQNVHERVVGDNISAENNANSETANSTGNTTGVLLFSSVIQQAAQTTENTDNGGAASTASGSNNKETEAKSLTEVAREYEESRAQKRKYEEVETFTGEEDEINIVDVSCKLFAFVNSNWEERGRGSLRLNDSKKERECSRVVFRTSGNLRLLLNTKVWAGMVAERPSQKSLRLTAMDNTGKIKVFLAMARPAEMGQLHKALVERIDKRKVTHPEECCAEAGSGAGDADNANNGTTAKNGDNADIIDGEAVAINNIDEEHAEASKLAEPEHEDCNEPSPKKSLADDGIEKVTNADNNAAATGTEN